MNYGPNYSSFTSPKSFFYFNQPTSAHDINLSSPSTSTMKPIPIPHRRIPPAVGQDLSFITLFHSRFTNSVSTPNPPNQPNLLHSLCNSLTPFRVLQLFILSRSNPKLSLSLHNFVHLHSPSSLSLSSLSVLVHTLCQSNLLKTAQSILSGSILTKSRVGGLSLFESLMDTYRVCDSGPGVFDLLFSVYARNKKIRDAFDVFHRMRDYGFLPNVRSCNAFLSSLLGLGRKDIALSFYREMTRCKISPNIYTFNMVLRLYCDLGKIDKAMEVFGKLEMLGFSPTIASFNTLIDAYCKQGLLNNAVKLRNSMGNKGLEPNVITFNSLINGFCKEGKLNEANKVFMEIISSGLIPSTVSYNILIKGYCEINNIEMAFRVFDEMMKNGVKADIMTYNLLILALCNEGKMKKASLLVKELGMANLEPNIFTFNALIIGQCKRNNSERAFQVFKAMKKSGFETNREIHEMIVSTFCKNDDFDGGIQVLEELLEKCFKPSEALLEELFEGIYEKGKIELIDRLRSVSNVRLIPEVYFSRKTRKEEVNRSSENISC